MHGYMKITDVKVYLDYYGILVGIILMNIIMGIKHMLGVDHHLYHYY